MNSNKLAFRDFFTAKDIAEPIISVTEEDAERINYYFNVKNFDVLAFRKGNSVTGYIAKQSFKSDSWKNNVHKFDIKDLVSVNTPLVECIQILKTQERLFIIDRSSIISIITRSDIEKPAVRMLFYGLITSFESSIATIIKKLYPEGTWQSILKENRIKKAIKEYNNLKSKNRENDLLDCTQFCDKTDILMSNPEHLIQYIELSKNKAKGLFKKSRELRDDLSHAQPLYSWFETRELYAILEHLQLILHNIENEYKIADETQYILK
ncbi:hypothetical protein VBD025_15905 [Virgibacillus flavescens]|uniref:hypothetical protein n=1 Tax=Virgibacillus flavescens TaxID=1611422 RepID=UPI003D33AA67